ncbi:MAG: hypothetical protein HY347_05250 [candidate division NC10 bacterium]|nr:hypothetical protein [candidate division NC10 bacterium]
MSTLIIDLPPEICKRLEAQARKAGKAPEALPLEFIEAGLKAREGAPPPTARELLQASGRVRPLSPGLLRKIIPGVTLQEVRTAVSRAAGPSLSEIILTQRGPKP